MKAFADVSKYELYKTGLYRTLTFKNKDNFKVRHGEIKICEQSCLFVSFPQ